MDKTKPADEKAILEESILNLFGFFDQEVRKQKGSKLQNYNNMRSQSPNSAKMIAID